MTRYACPICGDPRAYLFWYGEPPTECPHDPVVRQGICAYQRQKAEQCGRWRKMAPEAFDENGNMKPGMLGHVLEKCESAGSTLYI